MKKVPFIRLLPAALFAALVTLPPALASAAAKPPSRTATEPTVSYRSIEIDGVKIFYRDAGPADAPVVLLLHGFPSSSHMFRNLIPMLQQRYRIIAPDYPGFGHSDLPARDAFDYSFARYAEVVDTLLDRLEVKSYALYTMDYGAPVGYRLALKHPKRVSALVVQNGNAYEDGLSTFWEPIKAYWSSGSNADREQLRSAMTLDAIRWQYTHGVADVSNVDPTAWVLDHLLVQRPGNAEIQLDLFYDYRTNVDLYPRFQEFFREYQPPTLLVWGKNDEIFPAAGARAYLRDLPDAELHLLDTGHFALEDKGDDIGRLMLNFLDRHLRHHKATAGK